jgi:ABC-type xylose transport system permease subunit
MWVVWIVCFLVGAALGYWVGLAKALLVILGLCVTIILLWLGLMVHAWNSVATHEDFSTYIATTGVLAALIALTGAVPGSFGAWVGAFVCSRRKKSARSATQ